MQQKLHVSEKTKRLAFLRNKFHTSDCNESNQNKLRVLKIFRQVSTCANLVARSHDQSSGHV